MGNAESTEEYPTERLFDKKHDIEDDYTLLNLQTDIAYGEIKVLRSKNSEELVAVKSKNFQDKIEMHDYY